MQMKMYARGLAIGVPKTNLMATMLPAGRLYFRKFRGDKNVEVLDIVDDDYSIGHRTGTFIFTEVETKWFYLDATRAKWAYNTITLIGSLMEIQIGGFQVNKIIGGMSDVSVKLFDKHNQPTEVLSMGEVMSKGVQFAPIIIRGRVGLHPKDHRRKYKYRYKRRR